MVRVRRAAKKGGGCENKKGGAPHPPFFKKGGARSTGTPLYTLLEAHHVISRKVDNIRYDMFIIRYQFMLDNRYLTRPASTKQSFRNTVIHRSWIDFGKFCSRKKMFNPGGPEHYQQLDLAGN